MASGGGGKEGDWECGGCYNRNYAFRSFCNRCKQPRLLVDMKTPADSKWLPRIGDWICTGCTNNNYASREKCKKCGQPKEVAAMPAVAIPGASVPTHPTYFPRAQMMNVGSLQPFGGAAQYVNHATDPYGLQAASNWSLGGNSLSGISYGPSSQLPPNGNGWRKGDWMCTCGFHNYSSRAQCKKCSSPAPINRQSLVGPVGTAITALGTKRLASEEFVLNWSSKRLNAGQQYPGFEAFPTFPVNLHVPASPALLGKGAKQWRSGDWMCSNCNNHNYASREQCNRCKSQREESPQPVSVA